MQAMDEEHEPPMPNDQLITSEMTEPLVEPRPPGGAGPRVVLLLRLAMTECHTWLGIGGRTERVRRPRRMSRHILLALNDNTSGCCCCGGGGPDYLGSCHDCRRLIGREIKHSLSEEEYCYLTPADWNKAVPSGVERDPAEAVHRGGGATFKVIVDISVRFEFVYCEATALLLACDNKGGGGPAGRSGNGDGDTRHAVVLHLLRGDVVRGDGAAGVHARLPLLVHHRVVLQGVDVPGVPARSVAVSPARYRNLHGKMAIDPDRLQDYM